MFIQTEATANADAMKFLPGRSVLEAGMVTFTRPEDAADSPLARALFALDGVNRVTLDTDAVTIGKEPDRDWQVMKPVILGAIMEHFTQDRPVMDTLAQADVGDTASEDPELAGTIEELINTRIKPVAQQDGGDVTFQEYRAGVVYLELTGPAFGLLSGIENMLRHYVPEVTAVRDHREAAPKPGRSSPMGQTIRRLLDERINPQVASHGGHIALVDVQDDTVYIRLEGGCQGCGMADVTLKQGVATEIQAVVPTINSVLDVTDHAGGTNPYYQPGKGGTSAL